MDGNLDLGFWFLTNNLSDQNGVLVDDGVGNTYIQDRYSLFSIGLRMDAKDVFEAQEGQKLFHFHARGRALLNLEGSDYSLGVGNRGRQQIQDLNLESPGFFGNKTDLWLGRQTIYEAGGPVFDGFRILHHMDSEWDLGAYAGMANDPRNFTGYIGPQYEAVPFSYKFQAFGAYSAFRGNNLKLDAAVNNLLYKAKLDRTELFAQAYYRLNPTWSFSGFLGVGVLGDKGIRNLQASIISYPTTKVTNTLSFSRFATYTYKNSNASAIPVPAGYNSTLVGGLEVSTSSYNTVRNHTMFRVFQRNYLFTAVEFTRRTFDDRNRMKYTVGYRDPNLFGSLWDLRMQTDVIDNFRGFNTVFDGLLGREIRDGDFRIEGGGTLFANERDVAFVGNAEKEFSLRANAYYYGSKNISWILGYALHNEVDATNQSQTVRFHEIFLNTSIRF